MRFTRKPRSWPKYFHCDDWNKVVIPYVLIEQA